MHRLGIILGYRKGRNKRNPFGLSCLIPTQKVEGGTQAKKKKKKASLEVHLIIYILHSNISAISAGPKFVGAAELPERRTRGEIFHFFAKIHFQTMEVKPA